MKTRRIALTLLEEYEGLGKFVNLSLSSHKADGLNGSERGFLTALLYTAVERKLTYDYLIGAISGRSVDSIRPHTRNALRLGLCQLLHLGSVPDHAAVSLTVELGRDKGERGFINGIMRTAARLNSRGELPMPRREKGVARYLSVANSFPLPTVKKLISLIGEEGTESLLHSFNESSYTDITVNTLRIGRDELISRLADEGYEVSPSAYSSLGIRIRGSVDPTRLVGFTEGWFFVQDEACAVSVEALGCEAGQRILDVCAAPGGKSMAAAILSENRASVNSRDLHESKLSLITESRDRLGLTSVSVSAADATLTDATDVGIYDRVICDVPCSGLGVLGKKPDLRYRSLDSNATLPDLQLDILRASFAKLRPGGAMIYSTCTLAEEENSGVVDKFMSEGLDRSLSDFSVGSLSSSNGRLTLMPHIHGTDGFFMARIIKNL